MADSVTWVLVAFPEREEDRQRLRDLRKEGDPQLPAKYPGAVVLPCRGCNMALSVGPRQAAVWAAGGATLYCPWCMVAKTKGQTTLPLVDLGNPDSRPED